MTDAQFVALMGVLVEIRDSLVPTPEEPVEGCPHPEDRRVSFATPANPDHWVCAVCRFEHHGLRMT